jgi:hypothetical protein
LKSYDSFIFFISFPPLLGLRKIQIINYLLSIF